MQIVTSCPSDAVLELFLLGRLDDARSRELENHLTGCPACAERIGNVKAEDEVVRAMRKEHVPDSDQDFATDLIPLLKRLEPSALTTHSGSAGSSDTAHTQRIPNALLTPSDEPGEIGRLGPYRINDVIGSGGMGVVFRGFDPRLQRTVAIKVVHANVAGNPGIMERFVQEAQAAAAVEHDNIVVIHAVETHNGVTCITMPLLQGETLEQRLKSITGPLPLADVLRIARETASGLAAAHGRGLIHRDIKPANLWLEAPASRVKILDFGIAVVHGGEGDGVTGISGTPGYIAPEVWLGLPAGQAADLFSLGCVLYRLATGVAAFPETDSRKALKQALELRPQLAREVNAELPAELSDLIDSLLARQPNERPKSAAAVVEILNGIEQQRETVRGRMMRRRWLGLVAGAALFSGAVAWGWSEYLSAPVKPRPVRVTFVNDPDAPRLLVCRELKGILFDPGVTRSLDLDPGEYDLRPAAPTPGRELVPNRILVRADQPQTVRVALVGEIARHSTHSLPVVSVAVVPGRERLTIVSSSLDRTFAVWEPGSGKPARFANLSSPARCLAVSADGKIVATAGGNKQPPLELDVQLWNIDTLEPQTKPWAGHTRLITAVAFSPDGKQLLSADSDGLILWDLDSQTPRKLAGHQPGAIYSAKFSADGKQILTGGDGGRVTLWDAVKGVPRQTYVGGPAAVRAVAFVPNGFMSAGEDGVIRNWDGDSFNERVLTVGNLQPILALDVSPDGSRMLSAGADQAIWFWSVADGRRLHVLRGHSKPVLSVAFTADGRQAVSGSEDGTVRLWRLPF